MPDLSLADQAYSPLGAGLPVEECLNLFRDERPGGTVALVSTPGVIERIGGLDGPIRAMLARDGVFDGDLFVVAGSKLYRIAPDWSIVDDWPVAGSGHAKIIGSRTELIVLSGGAVSTLTSTDFAAVDFPSPVDVVDISESNRRTLYAEGGTGNVWYSALLDARNVAADRVYEIESRPDDLEGLIRDADDTIFIGRETTEIWTATGDASSPIARRPGGVLPVGGRVAAACCQTPRGAVWVGNDHTVYGLIAGQLGRLSNPYIERLIGETANADLRLWWHIWQGRMMVTLDTAAATLTLDLDARKWHARSTGSSLHWRARCGVDFNGVPVVGARDAGSIGELSHSVLTDWGQFRRKRWTGWMPVQSGSLTIDSVSLTMATGETPEYGQAAQIAVDMSRSAGRTWTGRRLGDLMERGRYAGKVRMNRFGMAAQPGVLFSFEVSDDYPLCVSRAQINEPNA